MKSGYVLFKIETGIEICSSTSQEIVNQRGDKKAASEKLCGNRKNTGNWHFLFLKKSCLFFFFFRNLCYIMSQINIICHQLCQSKIMSSTRQTRSETSQKIINNYHSTKGMSSDKCPVMDVCDIFSLCTCNYHISFNGNTHAE